MCSSSAYCQLWTKLGRRRKTLLERVLENSFRPGRYGHLLAEEPLPDKLPYRDRRRRLIWERLREQQRDYSQPRSCELFDSDWYRELAVEAFGRYVCALHGSELPSYLPLATSPSEPPEPTLPSRLSPKYVLAVVLICEECGALAEEEATGWAALLSHELFAELPELAFYCPECAFREFGRLSGRAQRLG
jgi:hypothetical protein